MIYSEYNSLIETIEKSRRAHTLMVKYDINKYKKFSIQELELGENTRKFLSYSGRMFISLNFFENPDLELMRSMVTSMDDKIQSIYFRNGKKMEIHVYYQCDDRLSYDITNYPQFSTSDDAALFQYSTLYSNFDFMCLYIINALRELDYNNYNINCSVMQDDGFDEGIDELLTYLNEYSNE